MRITWYEMKKALTSPIVLILFVAFLGFNGFQILSQSHAKEEINAVNDLIATYGRTITDESLSKLLNDLNEDAEQLGGQDGAESFLNELTYERYEAFSQTEKEQVDRLELFYTYYIKGRDVEERYKGIHMDELRSEFLVSVKESSRFEKFMSQEFTNWEERYEEIVATEEYKEWFFLGEYKMHSEMYRSLMKNVALQSVILIVLMTALVTNYEVEQRTQLLLYTTQKGRFLMRNKFAASLLLATLTFFMLLIPSFILYFTIYDFSEVWQTVVSSGLNWEYKLPYITWWELEVWQFFLLAIAVEWGVVILIAVLGFCLSLWIKNTYFTWILSMAVLIGLFLLPSVFNAYPALQFVTLLNVTTLLLNPHMYFSGGITLTMVQYFEVWSLLIGFAVATILSILSYRRFMKKDVV